ncbi:MAG TPA: hypothetical protein VH643_36670 [Gemmataceae bacterium]
MSRMTSEYPEHVYSSGSEERRRPRMERDRSGGMSTGWLIAGLAVLGLGIWAAYRFGPDFARYRKMERM